MKSLLLPFCCLLIACSLSGCGLMEDAFKAGVIFAVIIVAIIGILVWALRSVARQINKRYIISIIKSHS
jgi:hypothetical protein